MPLFDATFFALLLRIDLDLAATARSRGCRHCGARLHAADYPRKPRWGSSGTAAPGFDLRSSFCCGAEGCRRRRTPPSVRFLGRRVFLGAVVVLMGALRHGATPKRMAALQAHFGVSARTVERWRRWWRDTFPPSPIWTSLRGRLAPPVDATLLPASLLERVGGTTLEGLVALLRLLLPMSTSPWLEVAAE